MSQEKEQHAQEREHYIPEKVQHAVPQLHTETYWVTFALFMLNVGQVTQLASSGSFSSTITSVVGSADKGSSLVATLLVPMTVLAVPVSQAADCWGHRWFLTGLNSMGFVGALITSRSRSVVVEVILGKRTIPCG